MEECSYCDGFGWIPAGEGADWYTRQWRLILDPTVQWNRCRHCADQVDPGKRLQRQLVDLLLRQLDEAVPAGDEDEWRHGVLEESEVWRWRHLAIASPGPLTHGGWLLASELGVLRDLNLEAVQHHCERAGAPVFPPEGNV